MKSIDIQKSLEMLLAHAYRDTGGSRRAAMFLLSLWNGGYFKADLQALLYTDTKMFQAFIDVLAYLYSTNKQLYSVITEQQIKPVIDSWGDCFLHHPSNKN